MRTRNGRTEQMAIESKETREGGGGVIGLDQATSNNVALRHTQATSNNVTLRHKGFKLACESSSNQSPELQ
jgi:hypothetical protein